MSIETELTFEDNEITDFLKSVTEHYGEITKKARGYTSLISAIVFKDIMDHFKQEVGPKGSWAPWSKIYEEHMQNIGRGNNKKLQFNGRMRQTFTPQNYRNTDTGVLWYNNAKTKSGFPYAKAHNEGTSNMPARPFMWLSEKGLDAVSLQTLQYLTEGK